MLNNRSTVTKDDLGNLKYAVCTIGDSEGQEAHFDQALQTVTSGLTRKDLGIVDVVMEAHTLLETVLDKARGGGQVIPSLPESVSTFFGMPLGELTFGSAKQPIQKLHPQHPLVNEPKESFIEPVKSEQRKVAASGRQSASIF